MCLKDRNLMVPCYYCKRMTRRRHGYVYDICPDCMPPELSPEEFTALYDSLFQTRVTDDSNT